MIRKMGEKRKTPEGLRVAWTAATS